VISEPPEGAAIFRGTRSVMPLEAHACYKKRAVLASGRVAYALHQVRKRQP
jgi:hypothetical protein